MYEMPPILKGTPEQQIKQLRDYLVRLITKLNQEEQTK